MENVSSLPAPIQIDNPAARMVVRPIFDANRVAVAGVVVASGSKGETRLVSVWDTRTATTVAISARVSTSGRYRIDWPAAKLPRREAAPAASQRPSVCPRVAPLLPSFRR